MPDYYDVVKKPVDLATMEGRCVSDLYTTPQKFVDDFALMMNNAVLYNTVRQSFMFMKFAGRVSENIQRMQTCIYEFFSMNTWFIDTYAD